MPAIKSKRRDSRVLNSDPASKPLVFISANRSDFDWRDRLKNKIDAYGDQVKRWDDSQTAWRPASTATRLIKGAMERAVVAVVLLSPAYLTSDTTKSELMQLGEQADSRGLKLFPILLEECPWQQFSFLRKVQIWNGAKPIGDDAGDSELEKIAKSILDLARADLEPQVNTEPERKTADPRPEFHFSRSAKAVLDEALELVKKSGRAGVTSNCLLFAFAERADQYVTGRFVRDALNRNGSYEAVFQRFLGESGNAARQSETAVVGLPGKISLNVRAVLEQAANIAKRVLIGQREIHGRHLFAALLVVPDGDRPPLARDRLKKLGVELPTLRGEFREFLRANATNDNPIEWDAILGTSTPVATRDKQADPPALDPKAPESSESAYFKTYSAFIPDRAAFGPRVVDAPLDDSLKVGVYAGHLAQLIAAKDTFMPLSIGLFGAWGAGKSHFMDLLDEQLCLLTKKPGKVFHGQIVQIRFNAWHYLDTNLWANLVSEIFDQLFAKLDERKDTTATELENLKRRLADQSALAAEAKVALETVESVRKDAEEKLRVAMKARAIEEKKVVTLLDDLTNLAINDDVRKQLRAAANGLGLPKVERSFAELEARAEEVRSLGGRTRALVLAVFTGPGWWRRGLLLIVALAVPLGVAALATYGTPWMQNLLTGASRTITQVVAAIGVLSAWVASQAKTGNALVGKLESAYDKVKEVRAKREAEDDAALAQKALAAMKQTEEEARHTLREAEEKMKTIRAELAEMAPGRQLIRFLKERASAEDYRQHLGLVSLVRRDFNQLSNLLTETQSATDGPLPKIDRIVLYIDDLDRCRGDRVIEVLEAVHLLLAFPLFAVVVAVDPRWLRQSLLDHYPRLLGGMDDDGANSRARNLGRPATPQDYLEKIFQVPFNLQAMDEPGFKALVKSLFPIGQKATVTVPPPPPNTALLTSSDPAPPVSPSLKVGETEPEKPLRAPAQSIASPPLETVTVVQEQAPPDPQRLTLTKKEVEDVQRFQMLFQTPRAVKRLANTYSLIRVGVDKDEWNDYLGHNETPGFYRVPLLLLAVTSAFPALARPWLLWLMETTQTQWELDAKEVKRLADKHRDTTDLADWESLASRLRQINLKDWPAPEPKSLSTWGPRVARYSF